MNGWAETPTVSLDASGAVCTCPVFREACQLCHHMFASFRWPLSSSHDFFKKELAGLRSSRRRLSGSSAELARARACATALGKKVAVLMELLKHSRWWLTRNTPAVDIDASSALYTSVMDRHCDWKRGLLAELEAEHLKRRSLEIEAVETEARKLKRSRSSVLPSRYRDDGQLVS